MPIIEDWIIDYANRWVGHANLKVTYSAPSGTFTAGENVTWAGGSGKLCYDNRASTYLTLGGNTNTPSGTLTGALSGATVAYSSSITLATVYSVQAFYSWLMDVFDESATVDETLPLSAQTPTAFTLTNGWFIQFNFNKSFQYFNSGSIKTLGWNHGATYPTGVRVLTFGATYGGPPVAADIGKPIVGGTTGHTGVLLDYDNTAKKWWIRPTNAASTFNNAAEAITITGGTAGARNLSSVSITGENTWTNLFTLGDIYSNTQIYLYQNHSPITPWWPTGHIDILTLVKSAGSLIDTGKLYFFARQYTILYDTSVVNVASGDRSPVPLATSDDTNNPNGYHRFNYAVGSGTFQVGEVVQKTADNTVQGVITAVDIGPNSLTYYPFKYPLTDFANGNSLTGLTSTATGTVATIPADVSPADYLGITCTKFKQWCWRSSLFSHREL